MKIESESLVGRDIRCEMCFTKRRDSPDGTRQDEASPYVLKFNANDCAGHLHNIPNRPNVPNEPRAAAR
jgi:hypothetical protein